MKRILETECKPMPAEYYVRPAQIPVTKKRYEDLLKMDGQIHVPA